MAGASVEAHEKSLSWLLGPDSAWADKGDVAWPPPWLGEEASGVLTRADSARLALLAVEAELSHSGKARILGVPVAEEAIHLELVDLLGHQSSVVEGEGPEVHLVESEPGRAVVGARAVLLVSEAAAAASVLLRLATELDLPASGRDPEGGEERVEVSASVVPEAAVGLVGEQRRGVPWQKRPEE